MKWVTSKSTCSQRLTTSNSLLAIGLKEGRCERLFEYIEQNSFRGQLPVKIQDSHSKLPQKGDPYW